MYIEERYVKTLKDIDSLENTLISQNNFEFSESTFDSTKSDGIDNKDSLDNSLISQVENSISQDEYVYDEFKEIESTLPPVDTDVNEFKEIDDDINIDEMNITDIDTLEKNIQVETSVDRNVIKDIKDYKEVGSTNEAIAFGGEKRIENLNAVQTKSDELKCSRCGSSLIGAHGICPGCGAKISGINE